MNTRTSEVHKIGKTTSGKHIYPIQSMPSLFDGVKIKLLKIFLTNKSVAI
jgi:hypothetical protein